MYIGKVVAGGYHNLALTKRVGNILSWGAGDYGQLGNGTQFNDPNPRMVVGLSGICDIDAGLRHSMALHKNKVDLYSWGYNAYGELGLGDTDLRLVSMLFF